MARFRTMQPKDGPVPTFLCRNRDDVAHALAEIRKHMGISQLELDEIAGFHVGYTAKLEQPNAPPVEGKQKSGRHAINPMFDPWIGSLKVRVYICPDDAAPDFTQARRLDMRAPKVSTKKAQKIRRLFATGRYSRMELAGKFGFSLRIIAEIVENRAYLPEHEAA